LKENLRSAPKLSEPIAPFFFRFFSASLCHAIPSLPLYVFAGDGKAGYLIEPRHQVQKVIQMSGVSFTLHDLRRTFLTIAESIDISAYALKRLVNHKMTNDVTAGYIVSDVERLRKPMEQISTRLQQYFGINEAEKKQ